MLNVSKELKRAWKNLKSEVPSKDNEYLVWGILPSGKYEAQIAKWQKEYEQFYCLLWVTHWQEITPPSPDDEDCSTLEYIAQHYPIIRP